MKAVIFEAANGARRIGVEGRNHNGKAVILSSVGVSTPELRIQVQRELSHLCAAADWKIGQPDSRSYRVQLSRSLCLKAVQNVTGSAG